MGKALASIGARHLCLRDSCPVPPQQGRLGIGHRSGNRAPARAACLPCARAALVQDAWGEAVGECASGEHRNCGESAGADGAVADLLRRHGRQIARTAQRAAPPPGDGAYGRRLNARDRVGHVASGHEVVGVRPVGTAWEQLRQGVACKGGPARDGAGRLPPPAARGQAVGKAERFRAERRVGAPHRFEGDVSPYLNTCPTRRGRRRHRALGGSSRWGAAANPATRYPHRATPSWPADACVGPATVPSWQGSWSNP